MGKGGWIEVITSDGTPNGNLRAAASAGALDGMRAAIADGADVHYRVEHESGYSWGGIFVESPMIAAVANRAVAAVEFLLDAGASIETTDGQGSTPLLKAASSPHLEGQYELAHMLLRRGANVNALSDNGSSAIELALSSWCSGAVGMATLLAVNGISMTGLRPKLEAAHAAYIENYPEDEDDESAGSNSTYRQHLAWVDRVMGCPPFQIAIMHGMHAEATAALQIGRIDSSDCLTLAAEINETAAKSNCASTIALAKNALARWSPLNQHLCLLRSTMHTTNSVLSQLPLAACAHA